MLQIVTTGRSERSAFGGIAVALGLSAILWGIIAALVWLVLRT